MTFNVLSSKGFFRMKSSVRARAKNNFTELAPGFRSDLFDPKSRNHSNSGPISRISRFWSGRRWPEYGMRKCEIIFARALSCPDFLRYYEKPCRCRLIPGAPHNNRDFRSAPAGIRHSHLPDSFGGPACKRMVRRTGRQPGEYPPCDHGVSGAVR